MATQTAAPGLAGPAGMAKKGYYDVLQTISTMIEEAPC